MGFFFHARKAICIQDSPTFRGEFEGKKPSPQCVENVAYAYFSRQRFLSLKMACSPLESGNITFLNANTTKV